MRRIPLLAVSLSILMTMVFSGTALAAKPPPPTLTADICDAGGGFISVRYTYSGFKRAFFDGFEFETADGVRPVGGAGGLDPKAGSGAWGFFWAGTVVNVQATAIRVTISSKKFEILGVSEWLPITDNSLGGLANNGWPAC